MWRGGKGRFPDVTPSVIVDFGWPSTFVACLHCKHQLWTMGEYYHRRLVTDCDELGPIRQITPKKTENWRLTKSLYRGFQGCWVQKWIFCSQITLSLCFGLICVRGKLNPANSGGLKFRKYTPLPWTNEFLTFYRCTNPSMIWNILNWTCIK